MKKGDRTNRNKDLTKGETGRKTTAEAIEENEMSVVEVTSDHTAIKKRANNEQIKMLRENIELVSLKIILADDE